MTTYLLGAYVLEHKRTYLLEGRMKDIFELAKDEKEASEYRISQVLTAAKGEHPSRTVKAFIASKLYEATYSDKWGLREFTTRQGASLSEILDEFCVEVFGATYEEVLKAWDKFLG